MSGVAKSASAASSGDDVCPMCNQPRPSSSTGGNNSCGRPSSKRQEDSSRQAAPRSRKQTRSSGPQRTGRFERPWDLRDKCPVWVRIYNKDGSRRWEQGVVHHIEDRVGDVGDPGKIVVYIKDDDNNWVIPSTIRPHNFDPIPTVCPSIPNYKLSDYIVVRDECLGGLSDVLVKHWRCLKYHSGGTFDANKIPEQDVVGQALLDDNPESPVSLRNLVYSLMVDNNVKNVTKIVTGDEVCTAQHALAYFIGQLCGIELSESKEMDAKGLLDQIGSNSNVDCPISQIFLMSAMSARTKKASDPSEALYDSRAKGVFSDPKKLQTRMSRLTTALAAIHASQSDHPHVEGPAFALLSHGIRLMIDMRGTSDRLLDRLAEEGVCRPARVIRDWIKRLADEIDPIDPRPPPPSGEAHVVGWTFDNADFHLFGRVESVVPVGNVLLGTESTEESTYFNENYMKGLPKISEIVPEDLAATEEDDAVAQEVIDIQNIVALLDCALDYKYLLESAPADRSHSRNRPAIDEKVTFTYRSQERDGTVKKITGQEVTVEFQDGKRVVKRTIPLSDVATTSPMGGSSDTGSNRAEPRKSKVEMFNGERHKFPPSTTSIASVLTGLSSKNNETARQCVQEIISTCGEDEFYKKPHVMVADQEFAPALLREFFSRLGREDELPIIPCLAIGHTLKGLSVSMMTYYKCYFDAMLEAMGVKIESPEYAKYYKGSVIRNTNNLVTNFTEMLALSAAHLYLSEKGDERRVEVPMRGNMSPNEIITNHLVSRYSKQRDPTERPVVAIDSNMRPKCIKITDTLLSMARDFQHWAKEKWGTTERKEVGPSGFEKGPSSEQSQLQDPAQHQLSQSIEEDLEQYPQYRDRTYADQGDSPGLLTSCVNAGLLTKSSPKDRGTLAKKLYLYEVKKDKKAAIKFGPARKLPHGTNSTGLAIYDLLFGPERFVIIYGHYLTRIRPNDTENMKRKRCPRKWLAFFRALTVSTFMRGQPNYQRLALSFLIQLTLILKHKDPKCTDLALKRIRWTFCSSEKGDSHKCYPIDLLQEHSMVGATKSVGRRDPNAVHHLEARTKLHSYFRMRELLSSAAMMESEFSPIIPERTARVREQRQVSCAIALTWLSILREIVPLALDSSAHTFEIIQGFGDKDTDVLFLDRSRAYFRIMDAIDHIRCTASAFLKGYCLGYEVAVPPREYALLRCLHLIQQKKSRTIQSLLRSAAKKAKIDAEQSLTEDSDVVVQSSDSILDGISKAGEGKATIYPAVLSIMSQNEPYTRKVGQIGDCASKPIILARSKADANKHLLNRAKHREGSAVSPIVRILDAAKDLHGSITRRNGGNTVNELARDIICEMVEKYFFSGIEAIILTMDVAAYMTALRVIPHAKRGKMDNVKVPHGKLNKVRKGTDDLTPYGARSDLLTCGDERFLALLFDTVCNQARSLEAGKWKLHRPVGELVIVVVGGGPQSCVAVGLGGKKGVRLNSDSIIVSCQEVEEEMEKRKIVKSEEGEMMIYAAMGAMIGLGFTHADSSEGVDCVFELHSDDSDALGGISMQSIYNLESTCILRDKRFLGAIYLRGPRKSISQIAHLGNIFKTNLDTDKETCPTGRGFHFNVDLISMYYTLEQMNTLPNLPPGHRAISLVAVTYTLINHDYLRMAANGLTYTTIIRAMKSVSYRNEVKGYDDSKSVSPINLTRQAVFMGQNHNCDKGYNLPGILILIHHAFINRPATRKKLLEKYRPAELSHHLPYSTVRAASILAGELQPVPDPVALLSYLSCANHIFRRWTVLLNSTNRRTDDELEATCYVERHVKGRKEMVIEYNLCSVAEVYRETWNDEALLRKLKQSYYGPLLPSVEVGSGAPLPFHPFQEIKLALKHQGFYPSVKVSQDLLPLPPAQGGTSSVPESAEVDSITLLDELNNEMHGDLVDSDDEGSDEERSVAGSLSDGEDEREVDLGEVE